MEFGLNETHTFEIVNFLRFSRYQRAQRLKGIDCAFQDLVESRLAEDNTFTDMEVKEMLEGLQSVVSSDMESELIHSAHTNTLLLRQLFQQGEKWHLTLQADISELENRALLDSIKEFEEKQFLLSGGDKLTSPPPAPKPKLAPLNEPGVSLILEKELQEVKAENDILRVKVKSLESRFNSLAKESTAYKRDLECARDKLVSLERESASIPRDTSPNKVIEEPIIPAIAHNTESENRELADSKHEILRLRAELETVNNELDKKVQETSQFQNLKKILGTKNEQLKDLRTRIAKYEQPPE